MTTNVWYRESVEDEWEWCVNLPFRIAHEFADRKNIKHSYGMWWVSRQKPDKDKVPAGKRNL